MRCDGSYTSTHWCTCCFKTNVCYVSGADITYPHLDGIVMEKHLEKSKSGTTYNYCTEKNKHRGKAHATCYGRYMVVVSLRARSSVKGRTYRPRLGSWSIKDNEENKVWYSIFLIMIGRSWQLNLFPSIFFYDIDQFRVRIGGPVNEMRIWNSVHGISESI